MVVFTRIIPNIPFSIRDFYRNFMMHLKFRNGLLALISLLFTLTAHAQRFQEIIPGQLIVQLAPIFSADPPQSISCKSESGTFTLTHLRALAPDQGMHLYGFPKAQIPARIALQAANALPEIRIAQFDHQPKLRVTPNDPSFMNQWSLNNTGQTGGVPDADIDAPEAWNISTGGLTVAGDTIVIAVIDEGFDLFHPDIHFYQNHAEIAGNGIDDDGNGYIDDFAGWNATTHTGNPQVIGAGANHGTHVSGIAAAKGNNGLGISGVNWNAQVMAVKSAPNIESEVVEAYGYVLKMRRLYDQTAGAKGAFVVVTNSSFGVDFGNPVDYPIWCAMYDSLGSAGILSAISTMNINADVDVTGDIPTSCSSDYMIAVTNTNAADQKFTQAAYGLTTVDLGAPGSAIYSTISGGTYTNLTGTSMASPHVAGAVALLYSAACADLLADYRLYPGPTALIIKDMLLDGTDNIAAMNGITVTNGRLNLFNSVMEVQNYCGSGCFAPYGLAVVSRTDTSALLGWVASVTADSFSIRYRPVGSGVWQTTTTTNGQFSAEGLSGCTLYEYEVSGWCGGTQTGWSASAVFESEGCCRAPASFSAGMVTAQSAVVYFNDVYGSTSYQVRYRALGAPAWNSTTTLVDSVSLSGLLNCTEYEVEVKALCDTVDNGWSLPYLIKTLGCGACQDLIFCATDLDGTNEWIDSVRIDTFVYASGPDGGYGDYTGLSIPLTRGATYPVSLVPGFATFSYPETYRIWIDLNADGDFTDANELVFDPGNTTNGTMQGQFTLPVASTPGITRMRITMRWNTVGQPCANASFGETEDYCVDISTLLAQDQAFSLPAPSIYPNPTTGETQIASSESIQEIVLFTLNGTKLLGLHPESQTTTLHLETYPKGIYFVQITTKSGIFRKKIVRM